MKIQSFRKNYISIALGSISLFFAAVGCHSPENELRQYGYPVIETQKLQKGELLLAAKESQLALAMRKPDIPAITRGILSAKALDLPFWTLKMRPLPLFNEVALIGMNSNSIKSVEVKKASLTPFVQRVYLLTDNNQLFYTADWKSGGLATLPRDAVSFSGNSYRWKITPAGEIHVADKVDPFIAATSGINFELMYQDNATGYIKALRPDIYVSKNQMNLYPAQAAPIPDLPQAHSGSPGRDGRQGRRGEMGRTQNPGRSGMSGSSYGASGENGGDGVPGDPGGQGDRGDQGNNGTDGSSGVQGADGLQGLNGSDITVKVYPVYDAYHGKEMLLVHTEKNENGLKSHEKQVLAPDARITLMATGGQGGRGGRGAAGGDGGRGGRGGKGGDGGKGGNGSPGGNGGSGAGGQPASRYSWGGNGGQGGNGGNGGDGGQGGDGGPGGTGGIGGRGGNGGDGGRGGNGGRGSNVTVFIYGDDFFAQKVSRAMTIVVDGGKGGQGGAGGAAGHGGFGGLGGEGGEPGAGGARGKFGSGGAGGEGGSSYAYIAGYVHGIPIPGLSPGGSDGSSGYNGSWGKWGSAGRKGPSGNRGENGRAGEIGKKGQPGQDGVNGKITIKIVK